MPIKLIDLAKDVRTCTVAFEDEEAEVTYRPSAYTPEIEDQLQTAIEKNRPSGGVADLLSGVILNWEVLEEDGSEYEPTRENLAKLPSAFLFTVINAITEDMQAEREDQKNSDAGSRRAGRRAKARSGTRSSGRRATLG
jgi:hypothetical protein